MSSDRTLTLRVARIGRETPEILSFELAHPAGRALPPYEPGAHVDVFMPGGFSRQYSLAQAHAPGASRYVIGVKREGASRGGSASMHERVQVGDLLPVSAPRNTFALQPGAQRHLLLAGGIGMTPLLAMAQAMAVRGMPFELHLFARSRAHIAFGAALREPALAPHVHLHLDDEPSVQPGLKPLLAARPPGAHLYLCGPAGFMQAAREAAAQWPDDAVHTEYFAAPTDSGTAAGRPFVLRLARRGIEVPVAADQSAVDALHEFGIDIPVSCGQGLCGTCVVQADGSTAEHRDFCLNGSARQHQVALCCSRAKAEELVVQL